MSDPFMGEIKMCGFSYNPRFWAKCDGAQLDISQYTALYSLMGTAFGGNGVTNFKLPDMRGRVPSHHGNNTFRGEMYGQENITIDNNTMGAHTHTFKAGDVNADRSNPKNRVPAIANFNAYADATDLTSMNAQCITNNDSGGLTHSNTQPSLVVNFIVALQGVYPSRN